MARTPAQTAEVTADNVRPHDTLVGKDGSHLYVTGVRRIVGQVEVSVLYVDANTLQTITQAWIVAPSRLVVVVATIECSSCAGTGKHYSGGHFVNGVFTGTIGNCFRCRGTGVQNRSDVQRNRVYDAKYRRA